MKKEGAKSKSGFATENIYFQTINLSVQTCASSAEVFKTEILDDCGNSCDPCTKYFVQREYS